MANNEYTAPLVVQSANDVAWDETADVVVVGFGGAGAVAAIQARECGASVIVIDRFEGGGATLYSGGIIYAGGTRFQREGGYEDTAEEMYKYLNAEGSAVSPETLRRFCEGSSADMEWLCEHGVPYGSTVYEDKGAFPPDGYWIYYSGNEKMPKFAQIAKPAPRGHKPVTKGLAGNFYYQKLRAAALAKGIEFLSHSPVSRLVTDKSNRVIGVEINRVPESLWEKHMKLFEVVNPWRPFNESRAVKAASKAVELEQRAPQTKFIRAIRGVILATGGYNNNYSMVKESRPVLTKAYKHMLRCGSMGDTGFGIKLGESVGGVTERMDRISIMRRLVPPHEYGHGILVNREGNRFVSESAYTMVIGHAISEQSDEGKAWLILDAKDFWAGMRHLFFSKLDFLAYGVPILLNIFFGGTHKARSMQALAKKIGADPQQLAQTVNAYNAMATSDRADPYGKLDELIKPLGSGPYYAINMSLDNRFGFPMMITLGGLRLDEETGQVLREDGTPIEGLYGAGRVAYGVCSGGYMSGMTVADTVFSGRRAARAVVGKAQ